MAPPPAAAPAVHPVVREVTEDTPPDLLEGTMDLKVILPSGKTLQSTVDRKTPMMDLLIHYATANKINPAGHIVQVRNERGIEMPYKPSTPIGALDTTTIEIVPKNRVNEYIIVKKPTKVANQPFETTFRLQVHLPRNQLYVLRVSPKAMLNEILREVCQEKNLDITKYEIRHPVNLDHKLSLSMTVGETGLQEITVVSKNSKINSSVSAADIIALKQSEEARGKGCLDGSFKHSRSSVGDSSVSSESTGSGRGISPCRSEDSRSISPLPLIRPKTLIHSRTASNLSTCSSSCYSSTGQCKTNTHNNSSVLSTSQVTHQQVVMQAPPRTKKRAAPQPPGVKVNNGNTSLSCSSTSLNIATPNATCTTPTNGLSMKAGTPGAAGPLERPTPRKKEAPREPPRHHPLSHHQSLPLNHHSRHNSGSNVTDIQQDDIGPLVLQDSQQQLERVHHPVITKMSSVSSSMTNLTSVSSVSSTSLASSTGGASKKRRAPKPPALATLKTPAQIEEESTATDSEASTLRGGDAIGGAGSSSSVSNNSSPQRKQQNKPYLSKANGNIERQYTEEDSIHVAEENLVVPDDPKEIEVLSASPVSSLSSPSNSASESTSSSPIPLSSNTMKEQQQQRSLNTNEVFGGLRSGRNSSNATAGSHHEEQEYYNHHRQDESGSSLRSPSRSSSTPSSSSNHNNDAPSPPHADSTSVVVERSSRNVLSSSRAATTVDQDAQSSSCRPPSSNTQVSSSSTLPSSSTTPSPSARATMPMPLPRRKAPPAPSGNSSNFPFADTAVKVENSNANNRTNAPVPSSKISSERSSSTPPQKQYENKSKLLVEKAAAVAPQPQQQEQPNFPLPKPRPRSDRKSGELIISQTSHVIKPQASRPASTPSSHYVKMKSSQSTDSNPKKVENDTSTITNTDVAMEHQQQPVLSGQLKNPLAKYGIKVLPDNVLKERADRLKKTESESSSADSILIGNTTSTSSAQPSNATFSSSHVEDHAHKISIQSASKSSSDDFSDTGSITSLTKNYKISTGSIGRSGLISKPVPTLSKSDYTSQGSVRSLKQLTAAVASMSSVESDNYNDDNVGRSSKTDGYESDDLEENLDFFEPAHFMHQQNKKNIGNVAGGERREQSSLTKTVSNSPRTTTSPTSKKPADQQNEKSETVKSTAVRKPRVFSSVSAYDDRDGDKNKSPGAVSEFGFGNNSAHFAAEEEDSSTRLNRWQNMVSLNDIERENGGGNMSTSANIKNNNSQSNIISDTNKPKVSTKSLLGSSNNTTRQHSTTPPTLLQGDYHQRTKIHPADESQNDSATCHSSESEASYTDSGVPATNTVTPSPVNLDDVILDHEYHHAGSHSEEKFSSEDGEELKNSSRRSSIQSDHSEEWMNILEAKMNKDEEAIEKMFEAVLPHGEEINEYTPSPTPPNVEVGSKDDDVHEKAAKQERKKTGRVSPHRNNGNPVTQDDSRKRREIFTDSEDDYYEGNKEMENDDCKEMIETTVELHHVPVEQENDYEDEAENSIEEASTTLITSSVGNGKTITSTVPVRKVSKSESFSHHSEFNEATQRRKNFKSSRSNAMMQRSSQSSGSATDLRRSISLSDSEEELGELGPVVQRKFDGGNNASKQPTDRAVSMSDLSAKKMLNGSLEKKSVAANAIVHKATSLQKLSGETGNKEDAGQMETYRKQLEIQFEQWKEEFMKQHGGKTQEEVDEEENNDNFSAAVERTPSSEVLDFGEVKTSTETDNIEEREKPQIIHTVNVPVIAAKAPVDVQRAEEIVHQKSTTVAERTPEKVEEDNKTLIENVVSAAKDLTQEARQEEQKEEMKNMNEFPPVELRKKKDVPNVVYQYAGPPTIKMTSWGDRPVRAVSVKQDSDYIMGMGQQDPSTKAGNTARMHSFHGAPVVNVAPSQQSTEILTKTKRESSPSSSTPHIQVNKGWSAAINAPNVLSNPTGAVKSVLSAWKQRMEETEKEKNKPKEGPPDEIDMYGSEDGSEVPKPSPPLQASPSVRKTEQIVVNNKKPEVIIEKPVVVQKLVGTPNPTIENHATKPVIIDTKPLAKTNSPKVVEKSKTLGSSFRTPEKSVVFTISPMESNTLPRQKSTTTIVSSNGFKSADTVDSNKPSPATSINDISSNTGTLEDRKKFFQGIKPVENNGKEAPIPATNMRSNIAAIQKVFEKQRMTKMQQMGSQQSLYSDGTVSPVPSVQRNDSLDSRQSTLRRQNSVESHSSDSSSSVVLRVSQNSSGKASPQLSANEMVQKLFGRSSGMNSFDPLRRTPSPISSTTSTLSSSTSYERFTPSPTVVDGPNNSVRITTGGYKPPSANQSSHIRSVGNKAIIIVNGEDNTASKPSKQTAVNDSIIITDSSSNINVKKSPVSNAYMSSIVQQQQKQINKRESAPPSSTSVSQLKQNITATNSFLKKTSTVTEPTIVSQKNERNAQPNSTAVPPPPPPPPVEGVAKTPAKSQLTLDVKRSSLNGGNMRNSKSSTPTSPSNGDPRSEIFNAIKNSNGNFGLKKTGSTILLK